MDFIPGRKRRTPWEDKPSHREEMHLSIVPDSSLVREGILLIKEQKTKEKRGEGKRNGGRKGTQYSRGVKLERGRAVKSSDRGKSRGQEKICHIERHLPMHSKKGYSKMIRGQKRKSCEMAK